VLSSWPTSANQRFNDESVSLIGALGSLIGYGFALVEPRKIDEDAGFVDANVLHWFGISPDFADVTIPTRPLSARINLTASSELCAHLGHGFVSPFAAEEGVYFVQLERYSRPTTLASDNSVTFEFEVGTDQRRLADMSVIDRTTVLQVLAAEANDEIYDWVVEKVPELGLADACGTCPGDSVCSGSTNVGIGGCVCPAKSGWFTHESGVLDCASSEIVSISTIVPGSAQVASRSADTWQRGATSIIKWTAEGVGIPLVLEIVPTDAQGTVVAEPIRYSLTADQVMAGAFKVALPVTFAPTALVAHVGFLTQVAVEHAPRAAGRYLIRGRHFFLRNAGCIANEEHGECRALAACGGTADPFRVSGGAGTCESLGLETEAKTCCLIRDEPFPLLSDYSFSSPDILSPGVAVVDGRAILDGGSAHAYMGQTQKIRFAVMSENEVEAPWSLYHVADLTDEQASDPAWLAQSADRGGLVVRVASSDADGSTVESMHASTYRPGVFAVVHSIDYTFTALNAHSLSVHSQRFVLVQAGEAVVPVAFIDVEYAPCVPEPEFDWSNLAFTDRNYVGVCAPREACEDAGGIIVDAGLWGDDSSNCAPDLGKAVCCRYQWGVVNSGFRAAVSGDEGTGLSVGVIVALAAGALCLLLACVALACSALFLSRRRSAKQVALATAHQHAQQVSSGSARYKSRSRRASVQLRH
jgi:hypothetical protein